MKAERSIDKRVGGVYNESNEETGDGRPLKISYKRVTALSGLGGCFLLGY